MHDLAIIIVTHNSAAWILPCLSSLYAQAGGIKLDIVVVDNESSDGTVRLVESAFPDARVIRSENYGFAYGNNRGLEVVDAPFVLLINPDTEIIDGTLEQMVDVMRANPTLGLVGCRQLKGSGELIPTIRRFPSVSRSLFEALGSERYPVRASWLGERELDLAAYERETSCDWIAGSFMLTRRDAIVAAGGLDERYFMYCEEPDLCLRLKRDGWDVRHVPTMTICHVGRGSAQRSARLEAQEAYSRRLYALKNMPGVRRHLILWAVALGHALRSASANLARDPAARRGHRTGSWVALRTVLGHSGPPFQTKCGAR